MKSFKKEKKAPSEASLLLVPLDPTGKGRSMRVTDAWRLLGTKSSGRACRHFWRNSGALKDPPHQPSRAPLLATAAQKPTPAPTWGSQQHRSLPSTEARKGSKGGPEERQSRTGSSLWSRPSFFWPGERPGLVYNSNCRTRLHCVLKVKNPPPSHSVSILRLSWRLSLGLQKLAGWTPFEVPFGPPLGIRGLPSDLSISQNSTVTPTSGDGQSLTKTSAAVARLDRSPGHCVNWAPSRWDSPHPTPHFFIWCQFGFLPC